METPKAVGKCGPTDTPDTTFSSIFDCDDSPLSSPPSSVIGDVDDDASEYEEEKPQQHTNGTQSITSWDDPENRETARSQRNQRVTKKLPVYSNFFSQLKRQTPEPTKPKVQSTEDPVRPSFTTADDDEKPALRTSKRKQQATVPDSTAELQQNKVKTAPARRSHPSKLDAEPAFAQNVPQSNAPIPASSTVPSHQLRKRKLDTTAIEEAQPPSTKKVKAAPTKASPKSKRKPTRVPKRAAPIKSKKHNSAGQATKAALPEKTEFVIVLRMAAHRLVGLGRGEERGPDTTAASRRTFSIDHETGSFESTSFQSEPDQCAQPVLAPIPASSQLTSDDSSQLTHNSFQSHNANLAASNLQIVPEECEVAASQDLPTSPYISVAEPEVPKTQSDHNHSLQQQPTLFASEHATHALEKTHSFSSTQPTQLLSQPYIPLPRLASPLPEPRHVDSDAASDATSDATTVTEEQPILTAGSVVLSQEQLHLHKIAEELFANRQPDAKKPAPVGRPEVWAEGRQELCETLHYYRSYQSACYSTGGFVRSFMFDKVAHHRDYIDSNVIISRAGGGMIKDKDSNTMKSGSDQSDDTKVVQALRNCMKHYNPVVIITGVDNPHMPSQPPHQYCVLDYFKPTYVWVEKSGKSKILRYRFEKLNTKKVSWWKPKNDVDPIELGSLDPPVQQTCQCCGETSMQVYLNGWMCLQPSCSAFWHIVDGSSIGFPKLSHEPDETSLVYDPRFLKQKTPWPTDNTEYPLSFDLSKTSAYAVAGEDTAQAFWSGIVCPECGRCNSRLSWTGWDCANPTCGFRLEPAHSLIPAATLREPFWPLTEAYTMSKDTHDSHILVSVSFAHGYRINRYRIPGLDGAITHMIANKTIVEETGGPDSMFEELQQTDIDLRRRPMPNGQLKGESYCRHFSVNYGMPYKFIASTASHPFDGAARPITETRSRLNWAARYLHAQETARHLIAREAKKPVEQIEQVENHNEVLALLTRKLMQEASQPKEFNEVLALGYFESQKMNYHDDGEFGLGPTIATLSLGARGTMRIRMKARHYHGSSPAGVYNDVRPLPGCSQYKARLALQPNLDALKLSDPKVYRARLKQIPKELKLKHSGYAKDVLKMELGHGDIVFMHGAELQKYYEHAVDHAGKLRFALTCRYIDPESLKEGDKPAYEVGPDLDGYDGAKLC